MWRSSCLPLTLDLALDLSLDLALDVEVDLDLDLGACLAFDQLGCGGAAVLGGHHPARQRLQFLVELSKKTFFNPHQHYRDHQKHYFHTTNIIANTIISKTAIKPGSTYDCSKLSSPSS